MLNVQKKGGVFFELLLVTPNQVLARRIYDIVGVGKKSRSWRGDWNVFFVWSLFFTRHLPFCLGGIYVVGSLENLPGLWDNTLYHFGPERDSPFVANGDTGPIEGCIHIPFSQTLL